jgi:hypothetical protein
VHDRLPSRRLDSRVTSVRKKRSASEILGEWRAASAPSARCIHRSSAASPCVQVTACGCQPVTTSSGLDRTQHVEGDVQPRLAPRATRRANQWPSSPARRSAGGTRPSPWPATPAPLPNPSTLEQPFPQCVRPDPKDMACNEGTGVDRMMAFDLDDCSGFAPRPYPFEQLSSEHASNHLWVYRNNQRVNTSTRSTCCGMSRFDGGALCRLA